MAAIVAVVRVSQQPDCVRNCLTEGCDVSKEQALGGGTFAPPPKRRPGDYRVSIEISRNATREPEYDCRPICP